jgi:hypothetical protein
MSQGVFRRFLLPFLAAAAVLYLAALTLVSLRSRTEVIPRGKPLHFCGFYIDCHVGATVDSMNMTSGPGGRLRYVVHLRFENSAARATLRAVNLKAVLIDQQGYRLPPMAERFGHPVAIPEEVELGPKASAAVDLIFYSLDPLIEPKLWLTEGAPMERFAEKLMIGDTESLFHKPVLMAVR